MAKVKLSHSEEVLRFIAVLPADIQPVVVYLRQVMLAIDVEIAEHIKWNSHAFYFNGAMKSFDAKEYKIRKSKDFYEKLALLKSVKSQHDLSIILIEYADTQKLYNRIKYEIAPLKWDYFIGNIELQSLPSFKK